MGPRGTPRRANIVLDASVSLSWIFGEHPAATQIFAGLEPGDATVPTPWLFEVANGLSVAERRQRLTSAEVDDWVKEVLVLLHGFVVDRCEGDRVFGEILATCRTHKLSAYDAAYLELALRKSLRLATFDDRLRKAAEDLGVPLIP